MDRLNRGQSSVGGHRGKSRVTMNKARGSEREGHVTDPSHVRAALLVLLQNSLVAVSGGKIKDSAGETCKADPTCPQTHYTYTFLPERARLLPRYPRFVERAKQVVDENGAAIVEVMLVNGRMRAEDAIASIWETIKKNSGEDDADDEATNKPTASNEEEPSMEEIEAFFSPTKPDAVSSRSKQDLMKQQILKEIISSFKSLTEMGYIECIQPIATVEEMNNLQNENKKDGVQGGEFEFDVDEDGNIAASKKKKRGRSASKDEKVSKKRKLSKDAEEAKNDDGPPDDATILSLLQPHRKQLPFGSVYRVNTEMCHASLRSMIIGRLVQEFYGPRTDMQKSKTKEEESLTHVGAVVGAALTFAARQEHAPRMGLEEREEDKHRRMAEWGVFTPSDILPYLPAEVSKALKSSVGGMVQNLSAMLIKMSQLQYPPIVIQVEEAHGHPSGGKFEIPTRQLLQRLRDRILHRTITTRHGLVAARIVSILQVKGHMESDSIAEDAMVPAKEAREILHRLHRDRYVNLFDMHMTKQHNAGTAIYLWHVIQDRLLTAVVNDVQLAMLHLRLRRQHEVEVGKDWMDRAKEAGATEENAHDEDKKRYRKFCMGLERLDCACLQLDETLMVLKDL